MATASKTPAAPARGIAPAQAGPVDAIELLTRDHADVKSLFEQYEELGDRALASKKKLAHKICLELTKHAVAEEEIFYSAVRAAKADSADNIDEAWVEHSCAKDLIAQIISMEPGDDFYDAKVKVLSEQIEHHVGEEESDMFPKARKAGLDLEALGAAIEARKAQIELPVAPH